MLKHRLQSGVLLGAFFVAGVLWFPPIAAFAIFLLICALALWEFYALLDAARIPSFKMFGLVAGLGLMSTTWFALRSGLSLRYDIESITLFLIVAVFFIRQLAHRNGDRPWETMAGTFLGVIYVTFLFIFIVKLFLTWGDAAGRRLVLYLILVVKMTDIGAYFIGCSFGKHKLLPRVSPAKTWEGCAGGVAAGLLTSILYCQWGGGQLGSFSFSMIDAAVLGVLLPVAGIVGDLIESLFKRASGVKDSGQIIQGMGGILDVIDSLLFAAPVLYVYAHIFMRLLP